MKKSKTVLLTAIAVILLSGCSDDLRVDPVSAIRNLRGSTEELNEDELKKEIRRVRSVVEEKAGAAEELGTYHRLLAQEYMARGMYRLAYDQYRAALELAADNEQLALRCGLAAANLSRIVPGERTLLLLQAEEYYKYALERRGNFKDALYALAVLYIFELDRENDGREIVSRLLTVDKHHVGGLFLHARLLAGEGRIEEAASVYTDIIDGLATDDQKEQARKNRQELLDGGFDG